MKLLKNNQLKQRLNNNQLTIGSWLSIPSQVSAEIMAQAGFSWLVVDLEHSVISLEMMQSMFVVMENNGVIPIARVSCNDSVEIKRVMDAGAYGVVVPMINSPDDAKKAIEAVKYPPQGKRGIGFARAQGYGERFSEYKELINDNSVVICQIETKEAIEKIDAIAAVKGLDGLFIGPYDISGSYGVLGELTDPQVIKAEEKVLTASRKYNIPAGIHVVHPRFEDLQDKINNGFKIIAYGVDMVLLSTSCNKVIKEINNVIE